NGVSKKTRLDQLTDLGQVEEWKDFAGTLLYHNTLVINDATGKTLLDLGHINDVSELEVNEQPMGTRWYGNHVYDISKAVKKGDNYISIKIITTLAAYTKSLKNNKAAKEWSWGNLYGPTGLTNPVKILSMD
ncbi:MAG TPA: hypothetical protein VE035_14215, partial [Puia sp.]|nr:hypothetical protein [Puia sp.]